MTLTEAEIQLLALIYSAQANDEARSREALEQGGERYGLYREDLSPAFTGLLDKGLIAGEDAAYRLTESGRPPASDYFAERPDRYFYYYREFYRRAYASAAHSKLCARAFGLDLTQEGQMDMDGVHDLIERLGLEPGQRLLDLGCGAGGIAEYLSDQTGARVTGMDYSAGAIEVGLERTADKRDRVDFIQADMNTLQLETEFWDAAVMIDTIYWVADKVDGIRRILNGLKPGGQLLIVIVMEVDDDSGKLDIDNNDVAIALDELGVDYDSQDTTPAFIPFWRRIKQALDELHDEFIAEGNEFIYQSLFEEAVDSYLPAIENGKIRRYLFQVRK